MGSRLVLILAIFGASAALVLNTITTQAMSPHRSHKICGTVRSGSARCFVSVVTEDDGITPLASGAPNGYGPSVFVAAYGVRQRAVSHIGIVTAYDAPTIETDLSVFSRTFGLAQLAHCGNMQANGCFEKLNEHGGHGLPASNSSWAVETSMDVETAHGLCPSCSISLIEASSPTLSNLATSVQTAINRGASVVSNSYGGSESSAELKADAAYHANGITLLASSGDSGYGTSYPAASSGVIAVGGTSLVMQNSRLVSETAWGGSGSGCSSYIHKPVWQTDRNCNMRTIADISADADPQTGAAIYDSTVQGGHNGWLVAGGTSLAAPLVAGIIASSGHHPSPAELYTSSFIRDILSGANGSCRTYLCRSANGYDGPTGLGVLQQFK